VTSDLDGGRRKYGARAVQPEPSLVVLNPLGGALSHYVKQLRGVLSPNVGSISEVVITEPSSSHKSRFAWVRSYVTAIRASRAKPSPSHLIVTWPVLGYFDIVLLRVLYGSGWSLVIHDPEPLVFSVGYSKIARLLGRAALGRNRVIAHSSVAQASLATVLPNKAIVVLPLPMLAPAAPRLQPSPHPTVRVLGQFKPDRDTGLLESIAKELPVAVRLEVFGRNWPAIAGWQVVSRFLSEEELDRTIASSTAVLIPYRRFYQSAIAIRCLEASVPVIGPRESSLFEVLQGNPDYLCGANPDDWILAIEHAISDTGSQFSEIASSLYEATLAAWARWARSI